MYDTSAKKNLVGDTTCVSIHVQHPNKYDSLFTSNSTQGSQCYASFRRRLIVLQTILQLQIFFSYATKNQLDLFI